MNTKIIFFDIDGTILSHRSNQITDITKAAIKQAQTNGHLAFINTGRTIAEIDDEIIDLGFDGYVCGCGTYISYHDSVLFETTLDFDTTQMLIKDLRNLGLDAILEGSKAIYFDFDSTSPIIHKFMYEQKGFNIQSWDSPDISFNKFSLWTHSKENNDLFCEKYKDIFDFIEHDTYFYEVLPKGYSKGTGSEHLVSHLGISYENTYALGDSPNDLPMLEYVKHSIGMGNAPDEVKFAAYYVTKDVDKDGVAHALKHFNLI